MGIRNFTEAFQNNSQSKCIGTVEYGVYKDKSCDFGYNSVINATNVDNANRWCSVVGGCSLVESQPNIDSSANDLSHLQIEYKQQMQQLKDHQDLYTYNLNNNIAEPSTQSEIQQRINRLSQLKQQINEKVKEQNETISDYFNTIDRKNNVIDQQNKNLNLINSDISGLYQELESNKEKIQAAQKRNQFKQYLTYALVVLCILLIGIIGYFISQQ